MSGYHYNLLGDGCAVRIDHTALGARDPEELASWYEQWFGLQKERVLRSAPRLPIVFLIDRCGRRLEIVPAGPRRPLTTTSRSPHVAFSTTDVERELVRLENADITVVEDRRTSIGWRIAYLTDPEGNLLELVERSSDSQNTGEDVT